MEIIGDPDVVTSVNEEDPTNIFAEAQVSWVSTSQGYIGRVYFGQGSDLSNPPALNPAPDDVETDPPTGNFSCPISNLALGSSYIYQVQTVDQDGRTVLAQSNPAIFQTPVESQDTMLTHGHAQPRCIAAPKTSSLIVRARLKRKAVPNIPVLYSIITSDDHQLSTNGAKGRQALTTTDGQGKAEVGFIPGSSLGICKVRVTSSNAPAGAEIHVNVRRKGR